MECSMSNNSTWNYGIYVIFSVFFENVLICYFRALLGNWFCVWFVAEFDSESDSVSDSTDIVVSNCFTHNIAINSDLNESNCKELYILYFQFKYRIFLRSKHWLQIELNSELKWKPEP